jgi:hypothetical protein
MHRAAFADTTFGASIGATYRAYSFAEFAEAYIFL